MTTPCPPPDRLLAFASGELSDDQAATVESHIDACDGCRLALSSAARGDVPPKFGRYRIDTVLGSGGMGIVYRAWDPQLARAVAIKVVKRGAEDASGRARLVREAQSMAKVSHPNVCHVYDVGSDGDEVWVAMELIDGVSLRDWASSRDGSSPEVLAMLLGAAAGIAAAHGAGMIHRDVKPENVLVTRDGRAIVTDFGLARGGDYIDPRASTVVTDPYHTATGAIAGTPAYLAPEQITGDPIDERVDQFAWAVMAWELIAGSRPFPIVFAARVDAVRAGVTPPAAMDKRIAAVLSRALSLLPKDRFASMRELIDALHTPRRSRLVPILAALGALAAAGAVAAFELHSPTPARASVPAAPAPPAPLAPLPVAVAPPAPPVAHPVPVAVTPPPPAPKPRTVVTPAPTPTPPPLLPPPRNDDHITTSEPTVATDATRTHPLRRENAYASMLMFCQIPYDPVHPEGRGTWVDWGKVASVTVEQGTDLDGDAFHMPIIAVEGHRAHYRVEANIMNMGQLQVSPGDVVALCGDREPEDLYHYPGGPVVPVESAIAVNGEPQIAEIVKHRALYLTSIQLAAQGSSHRLDIATDRTYFLKAKSTGKHDGTIYEMDRWFLDVPPGLAGADQIASGQQVWVLVQRPELKDGPDGKLRLVVHAIAVLPEIFP